jgi:nucleoside-diphosphate-sugar epimerase
MPPQKKKVLVTGGGGFLGGAIARRMKDEGHEVRSYSRGHYPELEALGIEQRRGDLGDADAVHEAVRGRDLVFHVAAKAGAWGTLDSFRRANVEGTRNIVEACRAHGAPHLVYTSTPSVIFDGKDMEGADESVPYPDHYEAHYPATKAEAEKLVLAADGEGLRTVALRPHLIWGPGDTNLAPRIVERARSGALRKIAGEPKLVDPTYIDDAAEAHVRAAEVLQDPARVDRVGGKAYFITSGTPVETWTMVNRIVESAGLPPVTKSVSPRAAVMAGAVFETIHRVFGLKGEPKMTRWVARELSTAHWFDISAAREDLGYEPHWTLDEGFERLRDWFDAQGQQPVTGK